MSRLPRDELTERMQRRVERELADCDAALFVINAAERSAGGDRFIAQALAAAKLPVVVAVNKVDLADHAKIAAALAGAADLEQEGVDVREIVPVSALKGAGMEILQKALTTQLPEGPFYFPPEDVSDQPLNVRLAELIREAALKRTHEEIPHSIEVHVEDVIKREDDLTVVRAVLWVESGVAEGHPDRARAAAWCDRSARRRARRSSARSAAARIST